ncbi:MAG: arginine--tRNA ligase [Bacteroidetes bacterium]|nr:arginine--tRNA ligase [Bacteroidota bacterium]
MIEQIIISNVAKGIESLFNAKAEEKQIQLQRTKKEFEGDITVVVFPLIRLSKKSPEETATLIGNYLHENVDEVNGFNVIKGFLNLVIDDKYWLGFFNENFKKSNYGEAATHKDSDPVVIEYSAPNTNKPLHLGHIRNNLLGHSVASILQAGGSEVKRVNLVNDRGIHICKSMIAWQKWGKGNTPESSQKKGDRLVGDFYVLFDQKYKIEVQKLIASGVEPKLAEKESPLLIEAQKMLQQWERNDPGIRALWERMNNWVYAGFDKTYERMGISFDKTYLESETYLLGKTIVEEGLKKGILFKKDNGSVWADLTDEGQDEKLLLRDDGTSVYMTQDLGTAILRYNDFKASQLIYVVGNEQNYHFEVLEIILKKLGYGWAENIHHLSYGMVELPHGKMKSREGTVVDADDLMEEMYQTSKQMTVELGKTSGFSEEEAKQLYETVGMGALKYFMLKVDPKKSMLFNPEESIDFTGNTGPFIQYTYARIQSLLRKANELKINLVKTSGKTLEMAQKEKNVLRLIYDYPNVIQNAAQNLSPAMIANYTYDLVKEYNQFYQEVPVFKETSKDRIIFRLQLSKFTAQIIKSAMGLLGINVPDRM